ncbi:hypothetical protein C365_03443 [Cryptococcus neoformans Bt85]|nr:hypothetical protein C365_03443 [Cryptococcus neoformans var. grubii Bt85]
MLGSKRKRVSRACDRCHKLGNKCSPSETPPLCQPCIDYGQKCTYDRPQGRRGAPPKNAPLQPAPPSIRASITSERIATTNIDLDTTLQLAEVYRMTVYPVNLLACLETPFIPGGGSANGFLSISPESISSCSQWLTTEDRTITFFGVNRPQSPTPLEQRQTLHHRLIHKSTVQSRPKLLLSVMQKNRWMKVVLNCYLLPH